MNSFAAVDNKLAASQLSIGMSSNLAQVALSYTHTMADRKYYDAVSILACLAQVSIDSAKKSYDMDLMEEINRLKILIDIDKNKYPSFWAGIRRNFSKKRVNEDIKCPMNYLYNIEVSRTEFKQDTLPMSAFFQNYELNPNDRRRRSKKVEQLINNYSLDLYKYQKNNDSTDAYSESSLLLRSDFDRLIEDLRMTHISSNYLGFMSWLINRAFLVTTAAKRNKSGMIYNTNRNKSILLKVLYEVNPHALLQCFSKNLKL